jgi:hypothetical protein
VSVAQAAAHFPGQVHFVRGALAALGVRPHVVVEVFRTVQLRAIRRLCPLRNHGVFSRGHQGINAGAGKTVGRRRYLETASVRAPVRAPWPCHSTGHALTGQRLRLGQTVRLWLSACKQVLAKPAWTLNYDDRPDRLRAAALAESTFIGLTRHTCSQ